MEKGETEQRPHTRWAPTASSSLWAVPHSQSRRCHHHAQCPSSEQKSSSLSEQLPAAIAWTNPPGRNQESHQGPGWRIPNPHQAEHHTCRTKRAAESTDEYKSVVPRPAGTVHLFQRLTQTWCWHWMGWSGRCRTPDRTARNPWRRSRWLSSHLRRWSWTGTATTSTGTRGARRPGCWRRRTPGRTPPWSRSRPGRTASVLSTKPTCREGRFFTKRSSPSTSRQAI